LVTPKLDGIVANPVDLRFLHAKVVGVAGHFDSPSDVREFLTHLLDDERDAGLP